MNVWKRAIPLCTTTQHHRSSGHMVLGTNIIRSSAAVLVEQVCCHLSHAGNSFRSAASYKYLWFEQLNHHKEQMIPPNVPSLQYVLLWTLRGQQPSVFIYTHSRTTGHIIINHQHNYHHHHIHYHNHTKTLSQRLLVPPSSLQVLSELIEPN